MRIFRIAVFICVVSVCAAQTPQASILKWDTEKIALHRSEARNAVVYYLQIGKSIYQVTRESTKPDIFLVPGQTIQIRVDKDKVYIPSDKGKEVKYKVLGITSAS